MRRLWIIPIVHTAHDLGSLAEPLRRAASPGRGGAAPAGDPPAMGPGTPWAQRAAIIDAHWDAIETWASRWSIDEDAGASLAGVRVYQDALPVSDAAEGDGRPGVPPERIVRELAAAGSRNHRLLLALADRGATLMGTESPELLVRELSLARAALAVPGGGGPAGRPAAEATRPDPRDAARARALLEARDQFIARRIDATLADGAPPRADGETNRPGAGSGLLFIGALHAVERHLPADIRVHHPLGRGLSAVSPRQGAGPAGTHGER